VVAKRWILTSSLLAAISLLTACSGSSSSTPTSQSDVSIALSPAPSSTTVPVGSTTGIQFTPVVSNDAGSNGVDWALTCSNSAPALAISATTTVPSCGSLSICPASGSCSMHSASGTAVTYMPPSDFLAGNITVNVTAFATADHSKNIKTAVTVSSYVAALSGTYVFRVQGNNGSNYQIAGVLVLDGKGNITAGQETVNNLSGVSTPAFSTAYTLQPASAAASTYFIGPDGRGIITANFQPINSSSAVTPFTETFSLVVISSAEALIAENDQGCNPVGTGGNCPVSAPFGATGSGTFELQDATAATTMPSGAYAFVVNGIDSSSANGPGQGSPLPTAIGGVFNIDNNPAAGDISGNGSLADQDYFEAKPNGPSPKLTSCEPPTSVTPSPVTGSVSAPSSVGVVTITLTGTCFGTTTPATIQFAGYIVDSQHISLIETDDVSGSGGFLTSGIAVSQGSAAGTFTSASLSGAYVFGILGTDSQFGFIGSTSSLTSVGTVIADGLGDITSGITDTFMWDIPAAFAAAPISGTYALDTYGAGGTTSLGRADLTLKFTVTAPKPKPTMLFYLTGNGTAPLVMYAGNSDPNYPAVGTGIAYPQPSSTLNFGRPETYGSYFTQESGAETDGSGPIISQQNPQPPPQWEFTGTVDDTNSNDFNGSVFPILDSFTAPSDGFGRIAGTFMNVAGTNGPYYEYYLVDENHGFFVETDLAISNQTGLGYFVQACDVTSKTSCPQAAAASKRALKERSSRSLKKNLR
jgi:hypothetical protein